MSKPILRVLLVVSALVAASCSSAEVALEGTEADSAAVESFDYSTVDYDAESAGSALRGDRNLAAFPPPAVDISQIVSGGPPPDGIPSIDQPQYASVEETDFVADNEAVIAVEIAGEARAYPVSIMIRHELVNDQIGEVPFTVSYCPLCNSALVYDRRLGDRVLDFGTSGELYQSALVMYDRQTESLWTHFDGRGVVGHYAGAKLELFAAQTVSYGEWAEANPDGLVLTQESGFGEGYGSNPYVGYDAEESGPIPGFFSGDVDTRLAPKTRVIGIEDVKGSLAVTVAAVEKDGVY